MPANKAPKLFLKGFRMGDQSLLTSYRYLVHADAKHTRDRLQLLQATDPTRVKYD
jgi:hypothetical protein